MITKAQLESLIQREAEKHIYTSILFNPQNEKEERNYANLHYKAGASLLAPALLEAMGALELGIAPLPLDENPNLTMGDAIKIFAERAVKQREALQRIKELLGGGK